MGIINTYSPNGPNYANVEYDPLGTDHRILRPQGSTADFFYLRVGAGRSVSLTIEFRVYDWDNDPVPDSVPVTVWLVATDPESGIGGLQDIYWNDDFSEPDEAAWGAPVATGETPYTGGSDINSITLQIPSTPRAGTLLIRTGTSCPVEWIQMNVEEIVEVDTSSGTIATTLTFDEPGAVGRVTVLGSDTAYMDLLLSTSGDTGSGLVIPDPTGSGRGGVLSTIDPTPTSDPRGTGYTQGGLFTATSPPPPGDLSIEAALDIYWDQYVSVWEDYESFEVWRAELLNGHSNPEEVRDQLTFPIPLSGSFKMYLDLSTGIGQNYFFGDGTLGLLGAPASFTAGDGTTTNLPVGQWIDVTFADGVMNIGGAQADLGGIFFASLSYGISELGGRIYIDDLQVVGTYAQNWADNGGDPDEDVVVMPEGQLTVAEDVIDQAPSSVIFYFSGGIPETDVVISVDGTNVWTSPADTNGALGPATINITPDLGGSVGEHTIRASQVEAITLITLSASTTYTVENEPATLPTPADPDAPAEHIEQPVFETRKWILQDALPVSKGGIGSYALPVNPREMTSPHLEHSFSSKHTTAIRSGQFHVWQAQGQPHEWTFTGYCPTQEMAEKLLQYRSLNRRLYIIDHHNRAWKCVVTHVDIKPRLRHIYNGQVSDWGSDYTVTATIVDQEWVTPA